MATQLVVIDKSVSGYQSLLSQIPSGYTVLQVDSSSDGWGQIASFLSGQAASGFGGSYSALHILGHGSSGSMQLGASTLSLGNLSSETSSFAQIQRYMAPGADLMLYGCDIGQGSAGTAFVTQLAKATGWDVAASTNLTGGRAGDWVLEKTVGAVQAHSLSLVLEKSLTYFGGTDGNDSLTGTNESDDFDGGPGNDTIDGAGKGGWGNTVSYWGATTGVNVNLTTGVAQDGQGGTDTLKNIQHITGTRFADTLTGNGDENWFRPGDGNDRVDGSGGKDVVMYEDAASGVTVDLLNGTASGASIGQDTLVSIEAVHGSNFDDKITLSNSNNGYVFARGGNDSLVGGTSGDYFVPGSGNNTIDGGGGQDQVDFWADAYDPAGAPTQGAIANLATGLATNVWGGNDVLKNVEDLKGSNLGDSFTGNDQTNKLTGLAGNDTFSGGGGFDQILGGDGTDRADYSGKKSDYSLTQISPTSYFITDLRAGSPDGMDVLDSIEQLRFSDQVTDLAWATQSPPSGMKIEVNTPMNNFVPQGDNDFNYFTGDTNDKFMKLVSYDPATRAFSLQVVKEYGANPYYQSGGTGQYGEAYLSGVYVANGVLGAGSAPFPGAVGQNMPTGSEFQKWILASTGTTIRSMSATAYGSQDGVNADGTQFLMESRTYNNLDLRLLAIDLPDAFKYGGADTLIGNTGNDKLGGFGGADNLSGGSGDDTLWGGDGNDTIDGGAGLDTADYSEKSAAVSVALNGATAVNVKIGGVVEDSIVNVENIRGGSGNDSLTGDSNANVFTGGDGKDTIDGGAGIDTADYSDKTVAVSVTLNGATAANVTVGATVTTAGVVEDSIVNVENVVGGSGNDTLTGDANANVLKGGGGNDWLNGGGGADTLVGGAGDDAYWIDNLGDVITELSSDNTPGQQTFSMGNNNDVAIVSATGYILTPGAAVEDMMAAGEYTGGVVGRDVAINLTGNELGQGVIGNNANNLLQGMGGDDILTGGAGDDTLLGGAGNDGLIGGTGNDSLAGGEGDDFFAFNLPTMPGWDFNGRPFSAAMTGGADTVDGGVGNDTILLSGSIGDYTLTQNGVNAFFITSKSSGESMSFSNVERLAFGSIKDFNNLVFVPLSAYTTPTEQGDVLSAPDNANWNADGLGGNDTMTGNGGNDTIRGSAGNDSLIGGAGNDSLMGGDGNDTLIGGAGVDRLYGGSGNDSILGGDGGDKFFASATGNDTMDGESGKDFLTYGELTSGVKVNVALGTVVKGTGTNPATDTIRSIEKISGSNFADTIVGSGADEYFEGNDAWWNTRTGTYNLSGDSLDGGGGWDGLGYGGYKYGVSVNLQTELATDQFGVTDTVKGFEGVDGTNFADIIIGSAADNWIQGDAGYWGQDRSMYGFQSTADYLDGGAGWDTLGYIDSTKGVRVNLAAGRAIDAYGFEDTVQGFEAVEGSNFADTIIGSEGDNWIHGDSGNGSGAPRDNAYVSSGDFLDGGLGKDTVSYKDDVAGVTVDLANGFALDGYGFQDTLTGFEVVEGSAYDDVLFGDTGSNTLQGGGGNDSMFGDGGDDEFWADTSGGNDTMDGGDGWDSAYYGSARSGISVDLRSGSVTKPVGVDTIRNMDGISATNFADTIIGSSGNDWFQADASYYGTSRVGITQAQQSSADSIDGGLGNDKIAYGGEAAGVTVNLKTERAIDVFGGEDTIKGIENVAGSNFGDTIIGSDGGNWIKGDAGWGAKRTAGSPSSGDYLDGGAGRDTVSYGDDAAGVTVNLQTGRAIDGFGGQDTLVGFEMVEGSAYGDLITGDSGKNSLMGLGGNDTLYGGDGHDTIDGGDGRDLVFGGAGDDSITASRGDTIDGGSGDDTVVFDVSNVPLSGLSMDGDAASGWTLRWTDGGAIAHFTPDLNTGVWKVQMPSTQIMEATTLGAFTGAWNDQFADGSEPTYVGNVENLQLRNAWGETLSFRLDNTLGAPRPEFSQIGTWGNVSFNGTGGDDYFQGRAGNNTLTGAGGNDSLSGGNSSDTLIGGSGNDTLDGGGGTDTVTYAGAASGVTVNLVSGIASNDGDGGVDVLRNVEKLFGSDHNDTITANRFAEVYGGAGDDMLISGDGTAFLRGDAGNDTLIGSDSVTDRAGFSLGSTRIDGMYVTGDSQQGWTVRASVGALLDVQFDANQHQWTVQDLRGLGAGQDLGTDVLRNMEVLRFNGMDASGNAITTSIKLTESGTPSVDMVNRVAVSSSNTSGTSASEYLFGSTGNSGPVDGGGGNDTIATWLGGDTLVGGAGDDYLDGGYQLGLTWRKGNLANTLGDWDTASYTDVSAGGVRVDLSEMKVYDLSGSGTGTDTLRGIEQINLTRQHDEVSGDFSRMAGNDEMAGNVHEIGISGFGGSDTFDLSQGAQSWQDVWLDYSWSQTAINVRFTGVEGQVSYGDGGLLGTTNYQTAGTDTLRHVVDISGTQFNDRFDFSGLVGSVAIGEKWSWVGLGGGNDTVIGNGYTGVSFGQNVSTLNGDKRGVTVQIGERGETTTVDMTHLTNKWTNIPLGTAALKDINAVDGTNLDDVLVGSSGDDEFNGGGGWDLIDGGSGGIDFANYKHAEISGITVNMKDGLVYSSSGWGTNVGQDTLRSIEVVQGSNFGDLYDATGFSASSANAGSRGEWNKFRPLGGDDTIVGNGSTVLSYGGYAPPVAVEVNLGMGTAHARDLAYRVGELGTIVGTDTFSGVSGVEGSVLGDRLIAGNTNATLEGGGGDDTLIGGDGARDIAKYVMDDTAINGLQAVRSADGYNWSLRSNGVDIAHLSASVGDSGALTWAMTDTRPGIDNGQVLSLGTDQLSAIENIQITSRANGGVDWTTYNITLKGSPDKPEVVVESGPLYNTIVGTDGNETLMGTFENDSISGLGGRDTLDGGAGNDTLDGGSNRNMVSFSGATQGVVVDLVAGTARDGQGGVDTLINIGQVSGTEFADRITVNNGGFADGNGGDDTLMVRQAAGGWKGLGGGGFLNGGQGNDTLIGTLEGMDGASYNLGSQFAGAQLSADGPNQWLFGQAGRNVMEIRFDSSTAQWTVRDLRSDADADSANFGADTLQNMDFLYLSGGSGAGPGKYFKLDVSNGAVSVKPFSMVSDGGDINGNSSLVGTSGNDLVFGGPGDDTLVGGAGDDQLVGGEQRNLVWRYGHGGAFLESDNDVADYSGTRLGGVTLNLSDMTVRGTALANTGNDTLRGIEEVWLTGQSDTVVGTLADLSGNTENDQHGLIIMGNGGSDTFLSGLQVNVPWIDASFGPLISYRWSQSGVNAVFSGDSGTVSYGAPAAGSGNSGQVPGVDVLQRISALSDSASNDNFDLRAMNGTARPGDQSNIVFLSSGNDTVMGNGDTQVRFATGVQTINQDLNTPNKGIFVALSATGAFQVDMRHLSLNGVHLGVATLSGVDGVRGTNLNDTLVGGAYNDYEFFRGAGGDDLIDGGSGIDLADYLTSNTGVKVDLAQGTAGSDVAGNNIGHDTLRSIERVRGTDFADVFNAFGFSSRSENHGSSGAWNEFQGLGGNDTIYGNSATTLSYDKSSIGVDVNMGAGIGQALDPANRSGELAQIVGTDTFTGVSILAGSALADKLTGGGAGGVVGYGDLPTEFFIGGAGNDTIDGQFGRDQAEYRFATSGIVADLRTGQVQDGQGGVDTLRGIEVIGGSKYDDVMVGSDDNNSWAAPVVNLRVDLGLPAKVRDSVYVTGITGGNLAGQGNTVAGGDAFLTKLGLGDEKPVLWTKLLGVGANLTSPFGDPSTPTHIRVGAVATAADGSVYVTGQTDALTVKGETSNGGTDAYLMKYGSDGSLKWSHLLGSAGSETALGVTVDDNGAVYITGQTNGDLAGNINAGGNDAYVAKFEADGTRDWVNTLGSSYEERGFSVSANGFGDVYVTGYSTGDTLDGQQHLGDIDVFLTKYAADGSKAWTQLLGTQAGDSGYAVAAQDDGSVVVAGASWGALGADTPSGQVDAFVTKYSAEGTVLWTHLLGTSANDEAWSVATGADGAIYVVGETWGALDGMNGTGSYDAYITKYDGDGNKQWTQLLGTAGADIAHAVAVGADGKIYVSGETFGALAGNQNQGGSDAFVSRFTSDGVREWTHTLATAADDVAYGLAVSSGQDTQNSADNFQLNKIATTSDGTVYYAVALNGGKISHDVLDAIFNNGADTGDDISSRTKVDSDQKYVLLSSGELKSLLPTLDQSAMPTGWNALWTSTLASDGKHIAVSNTGAEMVQSDSMANYVVVKVQPSGVKQESFAGSQGNDTIDGGGGYDEVFYNYGAPTSGVNVNLVTGVAQDGFDTVDTLYNIEGVEGSDLADTIVGNFANNRIEGRDGNDSLDGGAGTDWLEYTHASGSVRVDLLQGRASGAAGSDTISNFENVEGSGFADTLIGNALANAFKGNQGDDTIDGGAGVDIAVYDGNYADYTIQRTGQLVSVSRAGEGVDTLASIEKLQFADRTYELNSAPTGAIKIAGTMAQNKVLTVNTATLADADGLGTLRYQWQADGVDIKNATGTTFTLTQAQVGKAMSVSASYTDGYGNQESVASALGAKVANVNDAPTGFVKVMGQTLQGQTLQALNTLNDADGMGPVSYQWYADAAQISGATGTTFKLTQAEVGKAITLKASYTDGFKQVETVWSPSTDAVANVNDLPEGLPTITGDLWVGGTTLGVQTTDIKDADSSGPLSGFQYQWLADGDAIDGATAATFALTNDFVGRSVSVQVRYVDGGNTEESVLSVGSAPIAAKETAGQVALSGVLKQGQLIQASVSDDDGVTGSVAWKWFANGQEIAGQTGSSLQLGQALVAKVITAQASYTDGHRNVYAATGTGALAPVLSAASVRVVNVNDAPTGTVTIAGTATQNQSLTANNTLADIDGMGTLNYQWQANGVNIAGANAATLSLVPQSLAGKKISVTVSYIDGFGTLESKSSIATNAVVDVNDAPTGFIAISGSPVVGGWLTASSDTLQDPDGPIGKVSYTWTMTDPAGGAAKVIGTTPVLSFAAANYSTYLNKNITLQATYSDGTFSNTVTGPLIRLGGSTADSITGSAADDRLYGNDGNDTISGAAGNDILIGGTGNDSLTGGTGNDSFNVDSGTDTITDFGLGADVLVVSVGATANVTVAAAWTATALTVNNGVVNISTNGFAVNLAAATGTAGFNVTNTGTATTSGTTLTGSALANTLTSGAGNDTLVGGAGNDTYVVNASTDVVTELADGGADSVLSSATYALSDFVEGLTLTGTTAINGTGNALNNTLNGNSAINALIGGGGDDTLRGDGGNDILTGGAGNDTFNVDIGTDTITDFGLGSDILTVSTGATANVTMAADWVATASTVNNGTVTISTNGFAVNLAAATGTAGFSVANTGSVGTTLTGSALANTLTSGAANDTLVGGAGNDTYFVNSASDVVTELDGGGVDLVSSSATYVLLASGYVENLTLTGTAAIDGTGNELVNSLTGNAANNVLDGLGGDDSLTGGAGADIFKVTQGTDTVFDLGNGADVLVVSSGATANVTLAAAWNATAATVNNGTTNINTSGFAVNLAQASGTAGFKVTGGGGSDTMTGGSSSDTLTGGGGVDTFNIAKGIDTVTDLGDGGADVLVVSIGASAYVTMGGTWTATAATANNGYTSINTNGYAVNLALATGTAGFNVTGVSGADTITGGSLSDTLTGGGGVDTLTGGGGVDTFNITSGIDTVTDLGNGGADILIVSAGATANVIMAAAWIATSATTNNGTANISTNGFAVNLALASGSAGFNVTNTGTATTSGTTLTGSRAANTLTSGAGNDTLVGGAGNDTYIVNASTDVVTELVNGGTDLVSSSATYTLSANVENLTLTGSTAINGTGNELNNTIIGNGTVNVLNGGFGDDTLRGDGGNDSLTGGAGADTFNVDIGTDTITDFGLGADILVVSTGATANVTMAAAWTAAATTVNNGTATISTSGFAVNLAAATGSTGFNLTSTGTVGVSLTGTALADTLTSGAGNDVLVGGAGNDTYVVNSAQDQITENLNGGTDLVQLTSSVSSYTVFANVENLQLMDSAGNSGVVGNSLDNLIYMNGNTGGCSIDGALGTDTLSYYNAAVTGATSGVNLNLGGTQNASGYVTASGTFGADLIKGIENLIGSAYADTFTGNSSANVLDGGLGNDTLAGWLGKDTLTGGSGADKFLFNVLETTANRDTISDFLGSEGDKIQFSKSVFTGFANVANGTITTAMLAIDGATQTASTRLIYSSTTGVLSYDADGSGTGQAAVEVALIGVTTHAILNTTHFEIVA